MHRLTILALLGLIAGCRPAATDLTEDRKQAIAAEIDSLTVEWWDAWSAVDFERGLTFLHDGPDFVWLVEGSPPVHSVAEARAAWPPMLAGLARQEITITHAETVVLSADLVWTLRTMDYRAIDTAGAVVGEGQSTETAVWVRGPDGWKVMLGHDS